jgi:hypothetical protein
MLVVGGESSPKKFDSTRLLVMRHGSKGIFSRKLQVVSLCAVIRDVNCVPDNRLHKEKLQLAVTWNLPQLENPDQGYSLWWEWRAAAPPKDVLVLCSAGPPVWIAEKRFFGGGGVGGKAGTFARFCRWYFRGDEGWVLDVRFVDSGGKSTSLGFPDDVRDELRGKKAGSLSMGVMLESNAFWKWQTVRKIAYMAWNEQGNLETSSP